MTTDPAIKERKKELRAVLSQRCAQASLQVQASSLALRDHFMASVDWASCPLGEGLLISAYAGYGDEIDPLPLIQALSQKGHRFCLPCVQEKGQPLIFRAYALGDAVRLGVWNIPEPLSSAPIVHPDVLLVPLLGFDRQGNRLGRGAGFYDRTLNEARAARQITAIGLAYAVQEVPQIPCGPHEAHLDAIVTDQGYWPVNRP